MLVIPRGSNKGLPSKPLLWVAGILIVALIGHLYVRSQGRPPAIEANGSQPLSPTLSAPAAEPAASGEGAPALSSGGPAPSSQTDVVGQPTSGVPLGPSSELITRATPATTAEARSLSSALGGAPSLAALPPSNSHSAPVAQARTSPTTTDEAPPAVAIPAATPAAPASPVAEQPTQASTLPQPPTEPVSTLPQPPTVLIRSLNLGPTANPQQTPVPVLAVPIPPAPPSPPVTPSGATSYTPSGTSVYATFYAPSSTSAYGFTIAPTTTQSTVTVRGVTVLPVAATQVQTSPPPPPVIPSGATTYTPSGTSIYATLYTPSGTSVYGFKSAPITTQSTVTLLGVMALPVAANQAQSVEQVLLWPTYRVEVAPTSDKRSATEVADRLSQTGFGAKVGEPSPGQYTVTLTPPPQSTLGRGLYVIKSVLGDLPIKIELVP